MAFGGKDEREALRPPCTVEVMCSYPGCGVAWWVDPLDPRLPAGPFDCGADHEAELLVRRRLSAVRIRYGVRAGITVARGPEMPNNSCGNRSISAGIALVSWRDWHGQGLLEWDSPLDLADPDKAFGRIRWDVTDSEIAALGWPAASKPPQGFVSWVGYETGNTIRKYVLTPCVRQGCGFSVLVDYDDPYFAPHSWAVGAWGGGETTPPRWWGRSFVCEQGLGSLPFVPCHLINGSVVREYEQHFGVRWTVWERHGAHAGTVLWYNPSKRTYGVLLYSEESVFVDSESLAHAIRWSSLSALHLWLADHYEGYDEVVEELALHVRSTSS